MAGLTDTREVRVKTPFGDPSDAFVIGTLEGRRVAFLARHGRGHRFSPSEINYRANIFAMKLLGRRANHFRQRRRLAPRRFAAARFPDPRPILRPHAPARCHVFRRRNRRARRVRQAHLHASFRASRRSLRARRREGASRRHVRLHGRSAILDAGRIAHLPPASLRRDRHDEPHRSEARARSGNLLRDDRHDHRLRLLASAARCRHAEEIIANLNRNTENVQRAMREAVRELPEIATASAARRSPTRSSRIAK